jgi:hypothetical protein
MPHEFQIEDGLDEFPVSEKPCGAALGTIVRPRAINCLVWLKGHIGARGEFQSAFQASMCLYIDSVALIVPIRRLVDCIQFRGGELVSLEAVWSRLREPADSRWAMTPWKKINRFTLHPRRRLRNPPLKQRSQPTRPRAPLPVRLVPRRPRFPNPPTPRRRASQRSRPHLLRLRKRPKTVGGADF